jgi:hypothetical protein
MTTNLCVSRAEHAALISAALVKGVEAAVEAGERLAIAQCELSRSEFLAMLAEDLRISESTASKLKAISSHPVLSQLSKWKALLPPDWTTLYALTKVPQKHLRSAMEAGKVYPGMRAKDVRALLEPPASPPPKPEQRDDDLPPDYAGSSTPAPDGATEPDDSEPNPITVAWTNANDKVRREFVSACWVEIKRLRDGATLKGNGGADHWANLSKENAEQLDRWIEGDDL